DDVCIGRIWSDMGDLKSARRVPIALSYLSVVAAAQNSRGTAVLLGCIDPVRKCVVGRNVIELPGRLVVPGTPGFASIDADDSALIDSENHAAGVGWIDPHHVKVIAAGRARESLESTARIRRPVHRRLRNIDNTCAFGIDEYTAEVSRAHNARVFGHPLP